MQDFKSHVTFSKEQRHGIFLLLVLIIVFQCVYFFVDFSSEDIPVDEQELVQFSKEIDSLRWLKKEKSKPKTYPFNPNYITDFKGSTLGMTNAQIDRLLAFRKQNKWINSTKQFKEVTQVSDSLLGAISPYFKYPEWVTNPKKENNSSYSYNNNPKSFAQKQDLNAVTAQQLKKINGIGQVFSERIIKYRNTYKGGFIADVQLQEVYGLSPEVIDNIMQQFTVKTPREVLQINLNTATTDQLVTIPYIDYDLAHHIIEYRLLREGYNSINELIKVKDFPVNKIKIIELYLLLEKEN